MLSFSTQPIHRVFCLTGETHAPHNGPWGDQPLWQNGSDPRVLIFKKIHRRHLNESQRAMIGARLPLYQTLPVRGLVSKIDPEREHEIFHQPWRPTGRPSVLVS
jgi:hypothetical protein